MANLADVALSQALSVRAAVSRQRHQTAEVSAVLFAVTVLGALLFAATGSGAIVAGIIAMLVLLPAFLAWLWRQPVRAVYVLVGAAVILPSAVNTYSAAINIPFFDQITTWTHIHIIVSVAELFMALAIVIWLMKDLGRRRFKFDRGSLMRPIGFYVLMVLVGEVHGIISHGDIRLSLWEIRSQVYMFVVYILACNLLTKRSQVTKLVWIVIIGCGIVGLSGSFIYLTQIRDVTSAEAILPHEQSYFFNAFLVLIPILFLYNGSRRMRTVILLFTPVVLIANLANDRRTAVVALGVALMLVLVLTLIARPARRRVAAIIILALAIGFPPYYLAFQNKSGILAEPARAVASNFHADPRDASSNLYRVNEDADIMYTMKTSPIIGYGFGKPMYTPYPLADISQQYAFWNILPHDSILWIWMRMGTIGYLLFWLMIGTALLQSVSLLKRLHIPELQGLALFVVVMIVQEVIFGYLDLQWTNYRNLIFIGVLFALISRLPGFQYDLRSSDASPGDSTSAPPSPLDGRPVLTVLKKSEGEREPAYAGK